MPVIPGNTVVKYEMLIFPNSGKFSHKGFILILPGNLGFHFKR